MVPATDAHQKVNLAYEGGHHTAAYRMCTMEARTDKRTFSCVYIQGKGKVVRASFCLSTKKMLNSHDFPIVCTRWHACTLTCMARGARSNMGAYRSSASPMLLMMVGCVAAWLLGCCSCRPTAPVYHKFDLHPLRAPLVPDMHRTQHAAGLLLLLPLLVPLPLLVLAVALM